MVRLILQPTLLETHGFHQKVAANYQKRRGKGHLVLKCIKSLLYKGYVRLLERSPLSVSRSDSQDTVNSQQDDLNLLSYQPNYDCQHHAEDETPSAMRYKLNLEPLEISTIEKQENYKQMLYNDTIGTSLTQENRSRYSFKERTFSPLRPREKKEMMESQKAHLPLRKLNDLSPPPRTSEVRNGFLSITERKMNIQREEYYTTTSQEHEARGNSINNESNTLEPRNFLYQLE